MSEPLAQIDWETQSALLTACPWYCTHNLHSHRPLCWKKEIPTEISSSISVLVPYRTTLDSEGKIRKGMGSYLEIISILPLISCIGLTGYKCENTHDPRCQAFQLHLIFISNVDYEVISVMRATASPLQSDLVVTRRSASLTLITSF